MERLREGNWRPVIVTVESETPRIGEALEPEMSRMLKDVDNAFAMGGTYWGAMGCHNFWAADKYEEQLTAWCEAHGLEKDEVLAATRPMKKGVPTVPAPLLVVKQVA